MKVSSSRRDLALSSGTLNQESHLMPIRKPIDIPVVAASRPEETAPESACSETELVALMVLGDSMAPEFVEGEILVIETGAPAGNGAYVVGTANDEFIFRQLMRDEQGGWSLHALNPAYPDIAISSLDGIKGVVRHKKKPGSRKSVKYYAPGLAH
jgi:hypothetical protein